MENKDIEMTHLYSFDNNKKVLFFMNNFYVVVDKFDPTEFRIFTLYDKEVTFKDLEKVVPADIIKVYISLAGSINPESLEYGDDIFDLRGDYLFGPEGDENSDN